ncbi:hypothetical protein HK096_009410, partial [Nowakowskiella sp. JEL0078]
MASADIDTEEESDDDENQKNNLELDNDENQKNNLKLVENWRLCSTIIYSIQSNTDSREKHFDVVQIQVFQYEFAWLLLLFSINEINLCFIQWLKRVGVRRDGSMT